MRLGGGNFISGLLVAVKVKGYLAEPFFLSSTMGLFKARIWYRR
jgi:hypothetical protein